MFKGKSKRLLKSQNAHKGTIKRIKSNPKYVFKKKQAFFSTISH